jgi:uncharacterized membrane protein required for colicin V production
VNTIDILIVLGVLLFVVLGIRDGFFKKIFGIMGLIGGLMLATKFMAPTADWLIDWFGFSQETGLIVAFFFLLILVVVAVNLFYRWVGQTADTSLKVWSRLAGGLLGVGQGLIAVSLVLVLFSIVSFPSEEDKKDSAFYKDVIPIAPQVIDYTIEWMPTSKKFVDELKGRFEKYKPAKK